MAEFDSIVTGGAGFIGSHLVDRLAERGRVLVIDDLSTGARRNLNDACSSGRVALQVGDLCDREWLHGVIGSAADTATLFHLATRNLRRGLADPFETHRVNATGTLTLVEAWAGRAGRFVHVSTSEVFGSSDEPLTETSPTRPLTVYGSSKLAGESYVAQARRAGRIDAVVLRPFNAYGPRSHALGDAGELIPRLLARAAAGLPLPVFGDGSQTRTFTFVADTVEAILRAADHPGAARGVWLIAGGEEISVVDVAVAIGVTVGKAVSIEHLPARPADLRRQHADASRTHRLLAWRPVIGFGEGLRRTWSAMRTELEALAVPDRNWVTGPASP